MYKCFLIYKDFLAIKIQKQKKDKINIGMSKSTALHTFVIQNVLILHLSQHLHKNLYFETKRIIMFYFNLNWFLYAKRYTLLYEITKL